MLEKNELLDLLDDLEVAQKIRRIVAQEQSTQKRVSILNMGVGGNKDNEDSNKKLKKEITELKASNKDLGNTLLAYQRECQALTIQNEKLTSQLRAERNDAAQKMAELREEIVQCNLEKSSLERELEHANAKLQKSNNQIDEMIREMDFMEQKANECQNKAAYYQDKYKNIDDCFEAYKALSWEIHNDLERVLSGDSPEIFFCYGTQWTNIEALWDLISYKLTKYSADELDTLKSIFDYFFQCYQSVNENYIRLDVSIGDEFDDDIHTRASNSAVSGRISEILLKGYEGKRNGKIKKSIVRM